MDNIHVPSIYCIYIYMPPRSFGDKGHIVHINIVNCRYGRMLFSNYSSAFNTIVPSKLVIKLRDLGLNTTLCDWILNFLMDRPQAVRIGSTASSTLTLNTGAPQGVCA